VMCRVTGGGEDRRRLTGFKETDIEGCGDCSLKRSMGVNRLEAEAGEWNRETDWRCRGESGIVLVGFKA
jgi:hypothetical protein